MTEQERDVRPGFWWGWAVGVIVGFVFVGFVLFSDRDDTEACVVHSATFAKSASDTVKAYHLCGK